MTAVLFRRLLLVATLPWATSCVRFDPFACSEANDCVLNGLSGQCEPTGYCSFPDPQCDSASRYSEHAPKDLAGTCVDASGTSTSGGMTSPSTTTLGMTSQPSTTAPPDESSSGGSDCADVDGDGAGPGCDAPDCDDDNPAVTDTCVYLGPGGDDANPGSLDAPWRTFERAVGALNPGDSLVVLDGRYAQDQVGTLIVDCEELAASGTSAAPIFVRAQNDRQAVIDRQGRAYGIAVQSCAYWRVRGLTIVSDDNPSDADGAWRANVVVGSSSQIELRQIHANHANRYFNEHVIMIGGSEDVLLEDVEVHDFFRSGFSIYASDRVTMRRCYANSHEAADLPACPDLPDCADPDDPDLTGTTDCPKCSAGSESRGDNSFYIEHSNDVLMENCVSEGSARGYQILGGIGQDELPAGAGIRVLQSLSIADDRSLVLTTNSDSIGTRGLLIEDFASIAANSTGIEIHDPDDMTLRNVSVFEAGGSGIRVVSADAADCGPAGCAVAIERVLVEGVADTGIRFEVEPAIWSVFESNAFGSGDANFSYPGREPFDDDEGNARRNLSEAATLVGGVDECLVYVPEASNMYAPFDLPGSIGANVIGGLVSAEVVGPLWSEDGFPCGVAPAEPEEIAGERCSDLPLRAGFTGDCAIPDVP